MYTLAALLNVERWGAGGLLEFLWHFTAKYAPDGNVGKYPDEAIARHMAWGGDAAMLISALVQAGWMDRCVCHRLRVHGWPEHADQTAKRAANHTFLVCYTDASKILVKGCTAVPSLALPQPVSQSVAVPANGAPTYPLPSDVRAETAIRNARWKNERVLYTAVGEIARRTGKEPGEVMEHVTAYKRRDGSVAPGRKRPELLRSDEAVEKSLADAEAWLASLDEEAVGAQARGAKDLPR